MTLTLVIETASNISSVAIGHDKNILFDSDHEFAQQKYVEVSFLVKHGLEQIGKSASDIEAIAVDAGPGRLMSIRNGISFANALAFASSTDLYAFCAFDLIGFDAQQKLQMPVVCTAKGSEGNAYVCLYTEGNHYTAKFGPLEATVRMLTQGLAEFAVAGEYTDAVQQFSFTAQIHDSKIKVPKASTFFQLGRALTDPKFKKTHTVAPVNEKAFTA